MHPILVMRIVRSSRSEVFIFQMEVIMNLEQYQRLTKQAVALLEGETNLIANLANLSALLNMELTELNWVGFYLMQENELVLGPFQGKPACVRIPVGREFVVLQLQKIRFNVCTTFINSKVILLVMPRVTQKSLSHSRLTEKSPECWTLTVQTLVVSVKLTSKA